MIFGWEICYHEHWRANIKGNEENPSALKVGIDIPFCKEFFNKIEVFFPKASVLRMRAQE